MPSDSRTRCLTGALAGDTARGNRLDRHRTGVAGPPALPSYGTRRHSCGETPAAHGEPVAAAGARTTVPHPGGAPEEGTTAPRRPRRAAPSRRAGRGRGLSVLAGHRADRRLAPARAVAPDASRSRRRG
ncbi:hypothetical protein SUDANB6_00215 [Streptomyces sp. enrichment culture]